MPSLRIFALISILAWSCCSLAAPSHKVAGQLSRSAVDSHDRVKTPAELLLETSSGYPIEFQAYVFFKVFSKLPADVDRRRLLRDLFDAALNAELIMPLRGLSASTDDSATYDERVSTLGLDRLSIQLHVIELANSIDGRLAVALFREINYPEFPLQNCSSKSLPDPTLYYRVLSRLYNSVHKHAKADDIGAVDDVIYQSVSNLSILDLPDIIHLLLSSSSDSNWGMRMTLFSAKLRDLPADDRSAEFVPDKSELIENLRLLTNVLRVKGLPVSSLLTSYRRFLLSVYQGERCGNNVAFTKGLPKNSPLSPIDTFNAVAASLGDEAKVDVLPTNIAPSRTVSATAITRFWQSSAAEKELFTLLVKLKKSTNPDEDVYALLSSLDQITADSGVDNPTMLFHEKCIAYLDLLDASHSNPDAVKTVESDYLSFLASSRSTVPNAHWIWEINRLLDISRELSVEAKKFAARFHKQFGTSYPTSNRFPSGSLARDLASSRDGALNLMGVLEEKFPGRAQIQ